MLPAHLERVRSTKTLEEWRKHLKHVEWELSRAETVDTGGDPNAEQLKRAGINALENRIEDTKLIIKSFDVRE